MDGTCDLWIVADYTSLVEAGRADKDISPEERAEVVGALRRTIARLRETGIRGDIVSRETAKATLFATAGEISASAYERAAAIISNL